MRKDKTIIALVLLLTLMPVGLVKATHFHEMEAMSESHQDIPGHTEGGHCEDTCPICHFIATPFIGSPSLRLDVFNILLFPDLTIQPESGVTQAETLTHSLRAPPFPSFSLVTV